MTDAPMPIRVLVADDHPAVRSGLVALLDSAADITVIAEAADGDSAVAAAQEQRPDVVLTDVRMPGATGIEITPRLRETGANVLVISGFDLDDYVLGALAAGADGYLVKSEDPQRILAAVRDVHRGDAVLSAAATRAVVSALQSREAGEDRGHHAAREHPTPGRPAPERSAAGHTDPPGPSHRTERTGRAGRTGVTERAARPGRADRTAQTAPTEPPGRAERAEPRERPENAMRAAPPGRPESATRAAPSRRPENATRAEPPGRPENATRAAPPAPSFTRREEEVLALVAQGLSNQQIASRLFVEITTVKSHLSHVLMKLQLDSRVQAALWWQQHRT